MLPESDKWGWKHVSVFGGFDKGTGTKRWKCNHCNLRYNGSYSRVRAHLLGFTGVGVKSCPAIDRSLREAFQILEEERLARKKERTSGSGKPGNRIRTSRPSLTCVTKEDVDDIVGRFFYANGLNVKVVNSPYFLEMAKAIAAFGPAYEPPCKDELSDSILSKEKGRIEKSVALVRESWPHTGCTILCVGHVDNVGCLHINIYVSSPRGLIFLKAVDIDVNDGMDDVFTGVLGDAILEVGPQNVVQIISHLGQACKSAESHMLSKFPHIFWSPCASHSICMLMEEIAHLDWVQSVVLCAKEIEHFMVAYQRSSPGILIENLEGSSQLLSPTFLASYGIVQRIFQLKHALREVIVGEDWKQWKLCLPQDVACAEAAIRGDDFWSRAHLFLHSCEPFLRFLAMLNIDGSVMGDLCDLRVQALEALRSKRIDNSWNLLEELIENRWGVLFSPLHAAGYILNPKYFGKGQTKDRTVMHGWKATLERYEGDSTVRRILREQLSSYWRLEGSLGEEDAVDCRDKMDPVAWWENFGFETPHLQTLAVKVLSQVSSVGMCEEIWQDNNDPPRQKRASRFGLVRVEDLDFVRNNLRLQSQRNGLRKSPASQRNLISSSPSEIKTWDAALRDQIKAIFSIHDML